MNARRSHWSAYTSTLALALHLHRASLDLVEAAHGGDSDVLLERAQQMAEMIAQLELDFGSAELAGDDAPSEDEPGERYAISAEAAGRIFADRHSRMQAIRVLCQALEVSLPWELREVPG